MYRYTLTEDATFAFKVSKHVKQILTIKKQKGTSLSKETCYRPISKHRKYPSKRIDKQEISHTQPEKEILALKWMKLVASI